MKKIIVLLIALVFIFSCSLSYQPSIEYIVDGNGIAPYIDFTICGDATYRFNNIALPYQIDLESICRGFLGTYTFKLSCPIGQLYIFSYGELKASGINSIQYDIVR